MRLQSIPVASIEPREVVTKLAHRHGVSERTLLRKHVLFVSDQPNPSQESGEDYQARVVRTAIVVDDPVALDVFGVGSAIKSPLDADDAGRGDTIALSRALRA